MNLCGTFARSLDPAILERYPPLRRYLRLLGETPLREVPGPAGGARILAKCEWANPTGTVKDRPVFGMVYDLLRRTPADRRGQLHVLEYTGGSLGLALARLCAHLGLPLTLVLSAATDPGVVAALRRHGAEVVLVPREQGFWGVMEAARRLAAAHPAWSILYQHENPANLWMHRATTGPEIARQLPPDVPRDRCAWVASVGTGGTLMGVYEALAGVLPGLQLFATTPAELPYGSDRPPNGLPKFLGSGGFGCGRKQPFVAPREGRLTGQFHYGYDECLRAMRAFQAQTGLRIGSSAAANWLAARAVAERLGPRAAVLTVFPSAATESEWRQVEQLP